MAKVKEHTEHGFTQWDFKCPGCGHNHIFVTAGPSTSPHNQRWGFNGDVDKPTFSPSLLNRWGKDEDPNWQEPECTPPLYRWSGTCHLYVTAGQIQYLEDCTHKLAGQTIDMIDM